MAEQLNDWIVITKKATVSDTQGGRAVVWVDLATGSATALTRLAAGVDSLSGIERLQAGALGSQLAYQVTIRYRADVSPQMRVSWRPYLATTTKTLEIHGVSAKDGGRAFLLLECGEVI